MNPLYTYHIYTHVEIYIHTSGSDEPAFLWQECMCCSLSYFLSSKPPAWLLSIIVPPYSASLTGYNSLCKRNCEYLAFIIYLELTKKP